MARPVPVGMMEFSPSRKGAQAGFTFMEIMVSLTIIAIAFPILLGLVGQSVSVASDSKFLLNAALLGQQKMADIFQQEASPSHSEQGDFGRDHPGFTWQLKVETKKVADDFAVRHLDLTVRHASGKQFRVARYLPVLAP